MSRTDATPGPEVQPYRDLAAWRADQEQLVLAMIERFVRLDRAGKRVGNLADLGRRLLDTAQFDEAMTALRAPPSIDAWLTEVADLRRRVARRAGASTRLHPLPLDALADPLGLSAVEVDVLRLLWIVQTTPAIHRMVRALWSEDGGPVRLDLVATVLGDTDAARAGVYEALAAGGLLRRWRLVGAPDMPLGPWLPLDVPEPVLLQLDGADPRSHRPGLSRLDEPTVTVPPERLVAAAQWEHIVALASAPLPRFTLIAHEGSAVRTLIQGLAAIAGRPVFVLDGPQLQRALARGRVGIDELLRDVLLANGWLLVELPVSWPDERDPALDHLARDLAELPAPVVVAVERRSRVERRLTAGFTPIELAQLDTPELAALWRSVAPAVPAPPAQPELIEVLSDHRLSREATLGAAREAAARAQLDASAAVKTSHAIAACRGQIDAAFESRATRVETLFAWKDLVLPQTTRDQLTEVAAFATHKNQVFEQWGFGRKYPYGAGLSALFSGPSGTGKTMAACVLARHLDRPLYRVDLSQVFDRYVGETEKNLARIFDAAEAGRVVLLFDEADALFAQRSEVKSSNDRYANLEVNYLLQKMEEHRGIALLTTNLDSSIDVAFRRRIRFTVHFPFPDEETREQLWQSMMPKESARDPVIKWDRLAALFEIAGGGIKNAMLRAAFLAAAEGVPIGTRHLMRAGQLECAAMGKLVRAEED